MILAFIDEMRAEGYAVESICRVLKGQGLKVAARTYRLWKQQGRKIADRTHTDATVLDAVRHACWTTVACPDGTTRPKMTPEGLYGRRKMLALIRRQIPDASKGAVDRAMRSLGLVGVSRAKATRTTIPSKDGRRAGDLLNRDFTAPRPDHTWVADFTYVRTWAGWVYVAFIVDVFAQMIVGWHAMTTRDVQLVMIPLRMALWNRDRRGHPVGPGQLRAHPDAGSQGEFNRSTQHLDEEGVDGGDEEAAAGAGAGVPGVGVVSGEAQRGAASRSRTVLECDCGWKSDAGRGLGCGRVAAGGVPVVPSCWRSESVSGA